ncbi:MAG: hypothetical protein II332_07135 [Kiritimatiellae bacterium]|nr:hypothetical protein [Kiritimatiellia bacterium]
MHIPSAWVEYALHQVTNNHKDDKGQYYRAFNKPKVEIVNPIIGQIVAEDKTEISKDGRIIFYSQLDENSYVKVVANPTEEGNYRADLTNVSSVYQKGKVPAKLNPLGAAVDRDGLGGVFTSKSTNETSKPNSVDNVNTQETEPLFSQPDAARFSVASWEGGGVSRCHPSVPALTCIGHETRDTDIRPKDD